MADPTVLSGSSLNTWLECPREWEYSYLWRLKMPPSYKMALGTAAHETIENAMNFRMEEGHYPPLPVWVGWFEEEWAAETVDAKPRNEKPEEQAGPHKDSGVACVTFYATEIAPTIVPYRVEMPIRFTINGWVWTGTLDLLEDTSIDLDGSHVRLRDHKFTAKRPDNPARYRWPMIGYAIGLRQELGIVEDDVQLDYIIRNKKPVHFPVALGGPVTDQDILDLAQEVENAMTGIQRGSFPPLGNRTGACAWCPYRETCPDSNRKRKG